MQPSQSFRSSIAMNTTLGGGWLFSPCCANTGNTNTVTSRQRGKAFILLISGILIKISHIDLNLRNGKQVVAGGNHVLRLQRRRAGKSFHENTPSFDIKPPFEFESKLQPAFLPHSCDEFLLTYPGRDIGGKFRDRRSVKARAFAYLVEITNRFVRGAFRFAKHDIL